ncbi:MAG TPA: PAS domain S-box protein [Thermoplasmata archaeon]|nr:PAS domain S-box protein [Thermoplasmata archaeon]
MNGVYLLPSIVSSIFLFSIAIYFLFLLPRKKYILSLVLICLASFFWNAGTVLTNLTDGEILWAEIGTAGLIFIPSVIFHFSAEYTGFFKKKYYLFAYLPAIIVTALNFSGYYIDKVEYKGIGFEPVYNETLFSLNSWIGLFMIIFSTFLLFKYYRESIGVKKRQVLIILFAIPANAILSFISYETLNEILKIAQFPVGSTFDFITISLIIYAILKFKLPVGTPTEIDFRILAETAGEGICIIDDAGIIEYSNHYFCEMMNNSKRKITGKPLIDFISYESRADFNKYINEIIKGNKFEGLEIKLKGKNGTITAEMNTSPIIWNDKIMGSFITIRDVEERKRMEEELRRQKTYFHALFWNSPEAIVSLDEKHRVVDINPAFEELFGYNIEELKGKNIDNFILPDEEKEKGEKFTQQVINGKIIRAEGKRKRKDGSLVDVSILGSPIFIEGKQVGIFGIYRDITARKEAEQEREFYNSLLRHDVANKNTIILGNLELLDTKNLTETQKSLVEDALKAARSSTELIDNIRKLHLINDEKTLIPIDIHNILSKTVKNFEQQAKNNGMEIIYYPVGGIVKADSFLENVFSNIIQNAILHSNCNKIEISGREEKRGNKTFYKILIKDDGDGTPEEMKKSIFKPRVKRRGSPGSGLGLYLVKKLIEKYGGYISVRNSERKGTVFEIYLPKYK